MTFIDIQEVGRGKRVSSFSVKENDTVLQVLGELPHGYNFVPASIKDANLLIKVLSNWIETKETEGT